jgi:hypothetical protein
VTSLILVAFSWTMPSRPKPSRFKKLLHRALAVEVISLSKAAGLARIPMQKLQQEMVSGG